MKSIVNTSNPDSKFTQIKVLAKIRVRVAFRLAAIIRKVELAQVRNLFGARELREVDGRCGGAVVFAGSAHSVERRTGWLYAAWDRGGGLAKRLKRLFLK